MGEISRNTIMNFARERHLAGAVGSGHDASELAGGNYLKLVIEVPARGNIYLRRL